MFNAKFKPARMRIEFWPDDLQDRWHKRALHAEMSTSALNYACYALEHYFADFGASKPTPETVDRYQGDLEKRILASSVIDELRRLYDGLMILWPNDNWFWLNDIIKQRRNIHWQQHPKWSVNQRSLDFKHRGATKRLLLDDWPVHLKSEWQRLRPKGVKNYRDRRKSPMYRWSQAFINRLERGFGRYLKFAKTNGWGDIPTSEAVEDWIANERSDGSASASVASYIFETWLVSALLWPNQDWNWLKQRSNDLEAAVIPTRPKTTPLVTTARLRTLGYELMNSARLAPPKLRNIIKFRDGLIIALLTEKPMRRRNLAALTINDVSFDEDGAGVLVIGKTKNNKPDEAHISLELGAAIRFWIDDLRPRLGPCPNEAALWINQYGDPVDLNLFTRQIPIVTERYLGVRVSPHRFRDCVAQTIAMNSPDSLAAASRLLGHKSRKSLDHYSGIARAAGAADHLSEILKSYEMPPPPTRRTVR